MNRFNLSSLTQNPGKLSVTQKAVVLMVTLVLVLVAGYFFDVSDQMTALSDAEAKETTLRQDFLDKKRLAVNLPLYKQQLHDIEVAFADLLRQLPNKSEMSALLNDINQAGIGRGLEFELFKPAPKETMNEFYAELPVTIRLDGNYHDFGMFLDDVSRLSRIVNVQDLQITVQTGNVPTNTKGGKSPLRLVLDATAKTYRYLDPDEVAEQRKLARGKKKPATRAVVPSTQTSGGTK